MKLFGCLLAFVFIIFITLFITVGKIFRSIFGGSKQKFSGQPTSNNRQDTSYEQANSKDRTSYNDSQQTTAGSNKVIDDDEGEYVDFEEYKDNK